MGDPEARMRSAVVVFSGCVPLSPEITINGIPYALSSTAGNPRRFTAATPPIRIRDAKLMATSDNARAQCDVQRTTAELKNGYCEATFIVKCEPLWQLEVKHSTPVDFSFYVALGTVARSCKLPPATSARPRSTDTTIARIGGGDTVVLIVPDTKGNPVEYQLTRQQLEEYDGSATLHQVGAASASGNPSPGTSGRAMSRALADKTPNLTIRASTEEARR